MSVHLSTCFIFISVLLQVCLWAAIFLWCICIKNRSGVRGGEEEAYPTLGFSLWSIQPLAWPPLRCPHILGITTCPGSLCPSVHYWCSRGDLPPPSHTVVLLDPPIPTHKVGDCWLSSVSGWQCKWSNTGGWGGGGVFVSLQVDCFRERDGVCVCVGGEIVLMDVCVGVWMWVGVWGCVCLWVGEVQWAMVGVWLWCKTFLNQMQFWLFNKQTHI